MEIAFQPLISVVIVFDDNYKIDTNEVTSSLDQVIDSVLKQTYPNIELAIIHSHSTQSINLDKYQQSYPGKRILVFSQNDNECLGTTLQRTVQHLNGQYCSINTGLIVWDERIVQSLVESLSLRNNVDFSCCVCPEMTFSNNVSALSSLYQLLQYQETDHLIQGIVRIDILKECISESTAVLYPKRIGELLLATYFFLGYTCLVIVDNLFWENNGEKSLPKLLSDIDDSHCMAERMDLAARLLAIFAALSRRKPFLVYAACLTVIDPIIAVYKLVSAEREVYDRQPILKSLLVRLVLGSVRHKLKRMKQKLDISEFYPADFCEDLLEEPRFQPSSNLNLLEYCLSGIYILELYYRYVIERERSDEFGIERIRSSIRIISRYFVQYKSIVNQEIGKKPGILTENNASTPREIRSENPKISIITVSLNLGRFLEDTIQTIRNQTFTDYEHIVIDGGSTDNTIEILKKYPDIRWISEKDGSFAEALWKGLKMAKGQYVMQCCVSDGYIDKLWFDRCVQVLDGNPDVSLVWGFPQYLSEDGRLMEVSYPQFHYKSVPQKESFYQYWLKTAFWLPENNFCARKEVWTECFTPFSEYRPDVEGFLELNYNLNVQGRKVVNLPIIASFGRRHVDQAGQKLGKAGLAQKQLEHYLNKVEKYRNEILPI